MNDGRIPRSQPFALGAMLGLPSVLMLPGAVHAGIAFTHALCRDLILRDCPLLILTLGGGLYGITLGVVLPVLVLGTLSYVLSRLGDGQLTRWCETASRPARVFLWVMVLGVGLPGSIVISLLAYGLPLLLRGSPRPE
jgi:hypothetical protein